MGNIRANSVTLAALLIALTAGATADPEDRQWVPVPGHGNILIDTRSIHAVAFKDICRDPPLLPEGDTQVDIKLNGHTISYDLICRVPACVDLDESEGADYFLEGRNIGHIPLQAVKAVTCPRRHPPQP